MQEFKLPDLGEGMQEAEIRRWLIKSGDTVKLDQPMVEVETDKAVVEIPSPVAATVDAIRVQEGNVAKLGEVLVTFKTATKESTSGSASPTTTDNPIKAETALSHVAPASTNASPATTIHRVLAAPAVRKRAFELGIDLEQVTPSHPSGRVTIEDIQTYVERTSNGPNGATKSTEITRQDTVEAHTSSMHSMTQVEPREALLEATQDTAKQATLQETSATEERKPLTGLRRRIAERMERSWRTIPHATSFDELDATELVALRSVLKPLAEQRSIRLTYMPLLVKLLLPALKEFPTFNASLDEEKREIIYKHTYHIGIATDSPEGLLVPVLRNADKLTVMQIAQQLEHLIAGAQKRSLTIQEVAGSTFTLNNVGSFGGNTGTPIINHPEVAILAVGRIQEKAIVQNGTVGIRTIMPLAMSFDHRVIDGAMAGKFLTRFKELVEQPQQLMLDML
ncbi:MAG: pyruvate dehydrogenase complex dihydrolipoyllysine-residue acetyltransferase [Ktedonobacteraceae bacterium]